MSLYYTFKNVSSNDFDIENNTGIYGTMALAGNFICTTLGIDSMGGYSPSLDAIVAGIGYSVPPIMALLFILDVRSNDYFLFNYKVSI